MIVLAFDTATADTAVGLLVPGAPVRTARHEPAPGERPGHAAQLLGLARQLLDDAGLDWPDVARIGVGTGPGTFTGLRIGVATARALAQAGGQELVAVGTLEALALAAAGGQDVPFGSEPAQRAQLRTPSHGEAGQDVPFGSEPAQRAQLRTPPSASGVLACLDARRGEVYVVVARPGASPSPPAALAPEALAGLMAEHPGPWTAVGDGAIRYRAHLEAAGAEVPADDAELHHVDGAHLCALAATAEPVARDALEPGYVREPDAVPTAQR